MVDHEDMANLPPITDRDLIEQPESFRPMPNGGFAWKCGLCNQAASSLTQSGLRCYQHGGTRKRAKDRVESSKAKEKGKPLGASGRPLKTGWYSRDETVNLFELVNEYRQAKLDPDATDEDMLHLRARLQRLQALEPSGKELAEELEVLLEDLRDWHVERVKDADGLTVAGVLETLGRLSEVTDKVVKVRGAFERFTSLQDAIEARHARLIKLAQVRADTRVKNKAAEQLDVFTLMLRRLMTVLQEGLSPEDFLALQRRMERDLNELPKRALEPHTVELRDPKKMN